MKTVESLLLYIFTVELSATACLSQALIGEEYDDVTTDINVYDYEDDDDYLEYKPPGTHDQKQPPSLEKLCHVGFMKCYTKLSIKNNKGKKICAYHKIHGLVNFQSQCEIALQNCIYKALQSNAEDTADDVFYYNGKGKACRFYLKIAKMMNKSIQLYYVDGLNLHNFTKEFEKIDTKNKYEFIDLFFV